MASRRRPGFDPKAGFRKQVEDPKGGVHPSLLKNARQSGQLNLSSRNLTEVPQSVWRVNLDVPEEAKSVSLDNTDDRWWEQTDLVKLILASNALTSLSEDIQLLPALNVLDVHDNQLRELPNAMKSLLNLQRLNLSHNSLVAWPPQGAELSNLLILQIQHNQLTELPEHIGKLYLLEELDVSHNQLTVLPKSIGYLSRLFRFNISNNKIRELPREINNMNSLRLLDCTHNELTWLPEEVGSLAQLEQLYLRHNRLAILPLLKHCTALKEVHVGNNAITQITKYHLELLPQVSFLDLRDNKIEVLPDEITILQDLERLDLTNNNLSTLPYSLGTLPKLKSVVLDGNPMRKIRRDIIMRGTNELKRYLRSRIEEAPEASQPAAPSVRSTHGSSGIIGGTGDIDAHTIKSSKTLDYSNKKLAAIPDDVWSLIEGTEINIINFSKNTLSQWPEKMDQYSEAITQLNLGFNKLTFIPSHIAAYRKIQFMDLRNNVLSDLPDDLQKCTELREITLSCNRFNKFPSVLYKLLKLEIVLLNDNQIGEIDPKGVASMERIATLDLRNNNIVNVPPELGKCTQLRSLELSGNPFRIPRPAILAKGTLAVLEYLRGRIAE